jgi:hypothetical protein
VASAFRGEMSTDRDRPWWAASALAVWSIAWRLRRKRPLVRPDPSGLLVPEGPRVPEGLLAPADQQVLLAPAYRLVLRGRSFVSAPLSCPPRRISQQCRWRGILFQST